MEKLGVFGGTFNPIHNGHLSLCTQICDALGLSKVLLIPTAIPPHKRVDELADGRHRLAMCRLAVQGDPRFLCVIWNCADRGTVIRRILCGSWRRFIPIPVFFF